MAFLGIKWKPLKTIGKVAKIAAPFIPGAGPLAAAAIAAGGTLLEKGGKVKFRDALKSGALAGGGSALLGGRGIKGVGGALQRAKGLIKGKLGTTLLGGAKRLGQSALRDPLKTAQLGLAGLNTIQAGRAGGRQNAALDRALGALGPGAAPESVNLSTLFADEANPYASGRPRGRAASAATRALQGGY